MSKLLDELIGGAKNKYFVSPIIARVGGKTKLRDKIVPLIPTDIQTYVEPFIGGASIFFSKDKYAPNEVINDKDRDITDILKDIQKVSEAELRTMDFSSNKEKFERLRDSKRENTPYKRLYRNLYVTKNSFSGNRTTFGDSKRKNKGQKIIKNLDKYKQRLKGVKILNEDYSKVVSKYNKADSFFYLDPPYSKQDPSWGYKFNLSPEQILDVLKTIKGKFLMSYDDSKENREIFKQFNLYVVPTSYELGTQKNPIKINELLISNYPLKNESGVSPKSIKGGNISPKIHSKFKKQLKKIGILPRTYLSKAKQMAKKNKYNDTLRFSDDGIHKLMIESPDGSIKRFGRVGYGDFILWSFLEKKGEVEKGYARMKRNVFQKSHGALSEQRDIDDPYAPNNLALNILW
jgi:DNA adenine methylase